LMSPDPISSPIVVFLRPKSAMLVAGEWRGKCRKWAWT
jgi:hypothetical protein